MSNIVQHEIFINSDDVPRLRAILNTAELGLDSAYKAGSMDVLSYSVLVEKIKSCKDWIAFLDQLCSRKFKYTEDGVSIIDYDDDKLMDFLNNQNIF